MHRSPFFKRGGILTKLDLCNAYPVVRIRSGDEWKTAYKIPIKHLQYKLMLFGLSDALAVFQALVNDVLLRSMLNMFILSIFLSSLRRRRNTYSMFNLVLRRLLEKSLFVKRRASSTCLPWLSWGSLFDKIQAMAE